MAMATSTMLTIATIATIASAATAAYSAYASGQTQKKAADFNAEIQNRAADDALQRGAQAAAERRQKVRLLKSQQVTGFAASGMDVDSGTPLQILTETEGMGELDALRIVNNAQRQAAGLQAQAELDVFQGRAAARTGSLNAGASLLGAASNAYYGYRRYTSDPGSKAAA